jgi:hypothetical protein
MKYCITTYNYSNSREFLYTVGFSGNENSEIFYLTLVKDQNASNVEVYLIKNEEPILMNNEILIDSFFSFKLKVIFNSVQENFNLVLKNSTTNEELTKYKFNYIGEEL